MRRSSGWLVAAARAPRARRARPPRAGAAARADRRAPATPTARAERLVVVAARCAAAAAPCRSSSSTRSTGCARRRSAARSRLAFAAARRRAHRGRAAARRHRGAAEATYPPPEHPRASRTRRADRATRAASADHAPRPARRSRPAAAGDGARRRAARARRLARPGARHERARTRRRGARGRRLVDERRASRSRADDDRARTRSTPPSPRAPTARRLGVAGRRRAARPGDAATCPPARADWAPEGILAYSKICTHAGCAVALLPHAAASSRTEPRPALVCPCHYSTFDPADRRHASLVRPGRPAAAAAAAARSTADGDAARGRRRSPGRVGPSWWGVAPVVIAAPTPSRFLDERAGAAPLAAQGAALRLPRPLVVPARRDRALRFVVLVATGVYLTLFFEPSTRADGLRRARTRRCAGREMTQAYRSAVDISFDVKAGLLIRQTHHWAANVFVAAIVAAPAAGLLHRAPSASRAS